MAGLTRTISLAVVALAAFCLVAAPARAAEPTPRPPTCAERFPAEGPAGVDLRLGCIVSEVTGLWRPDAAGAPPTLSAYAIALAALVAAGVGLGIVATRLVARRAGTRLAPTTPDAWWVCASCSSINGFVASRCYNCGAARPADAAANAMLTADQPEVTQSFGRGKHDR